MDQPQIHFEVFVRRAGAATHQLELATEERARAISTAEELLASGRAVAVKVTKEILDPETRAFKSITLLTKGAPDRRKPRKVVEQGPLCVSPADLYTVHARERIGDLLGGWLAKHRVTAWELLHRPDLAERLEARGIELQHALQKMAVPEAQDRGASVHEMMRHFQRLADRTIERLIKDARRGAFPDLTAESFAAACARLVGHADRQYLLGAAVAEHLGGAVGWRDKVDRLLDLADGAPAEPAARAFAFNVLEQPLAEIVGSRVGMADLIGPGLDLGGGLAALTRLAAPNTLEALVRAEPGLGRHLPPLDGPALRLARWLEAPALRSVRVAIGQRVLRELRGRRRLRPEDPRGEIELMRALAMALTAAGGDPVALEDVRSAFVERSQVTVSAGFVEAYLGQGRPAAEEARDLVLLLENVTGSANRREAARWLASCVSTLRFETEARTVGESPLPRLAALAELQRAILRVGGDLIEGQKAAEVLGALGGRIEAEAKLAHLLSRAPVPLVQRLTPLLKLAAGETAPFGPAADRAKAEAMRLVRSPEAREALSRSPDALDALRALMPAADAA